MVSHRPRAAIFALLLPLMSIAACDKVPLLAPTGTVITLIPQASTAALNSEMIIIATVIENGVASAPDNGGGTNPGTSSRAGAGTPVQNGTVVSFTTTIGRLEPADARTHNGQVSVKLITGNTSGLATITAYSGGASTQITNFKVGAAAAATILLTAAPTTLGSSGGTTTITASVVDDQGGPVSGVSVNFVTDKGTLSAATATTDASGRATTTLTTTATAKVTATAGGLVNSTGVTVTVSPTALTSFKADTANPVAGQVVVFSVTPNANANLQNVRVNFGDGHTTDLGPISGPAATTTPNVYCSAGSYTATATASDAAGGSGSLSTTVFVSALPVTLTGGTSTTVGTSVTFTASFSGAGTPQVSRFNWNWDDGTAPYDTGGPSTTHTFTTRGQKTVRVDVFGVGCGKIGTATLVLNVT
jgi:adhesin/invasin